MTTQKTQQNILTSRTLILITLLLNLFFVFGVHFVFADETVPSATLDSSAENKIKVCKDPTCENPKPAIIDFNNNDGSPLSIEKGKYVVGKAWSKELGWVTFDSAPGGVYISDPETGLLKGIAWSEKSGAINFGVTGQELKMDPFTGEWSGWAWASGPLGGWIKFNCKESSCLRMTWNKESTGPTFSTTFPAKGEEGQNFVPINIPIKPGKIVSSISNSLSSSLAYISNSASLSLAYIFNNSSLTFAYVSNGFFSSSLSSLSSKTYLTFTNFTSDVSSGIASITNSVYSTLTDFTNDVSSGLAGLYIGTSDLAMNTYNSLSSSMINTRASVLNFLYSFSTKDFSLASNTFSRKLPVSTRSPQFSHRTSSLSSSFLVLDMSKTFSNSFNTFAHSTTDLFNKTVKLINDASGMTANAYSAYSAFLIETKTSLFEF